MIKYLVFLKEKKSLIKKIFFTLSICSCINILTFSQKSNFQSWNSISAKIALGRKTDLFISELGSFLPTNNYQLNYTQTQLGIGYNINKIISVRLSDQLNYIPNSSRSLRNRIYFRGNVDNNFNRSLKSEHGLQFEFHDKNEHRYSRRIIFINSLSLRKRFSPLRLRPSISYWLYYNLGGRPIQYYDKTGDPSLSQTPDGFHRGRFYATMNSKVSKAIRLSVYYLNQQEFNLFTPSNRSINVVNPLTGRIVRPYDDFNAIGLSLQFVFGKD